MVLIRRKSANWYLSLFCACYKRDYATSGAVLELNYVSSDTMDQWDETKLKSVVDKKHGEGNKQKNRTEIVSGLLRLMTFFFLFIQLDGAHLWFNDGFCIVM